jgi:hypothetical protein
MQRRAPLRTSSPSHPRLESGKEEWHSQWYLIHFSDATPFGRPSSFCSNIHCINKIRSINKKERNYDRSHDWNT